jgi:hypothetical protein
MKIVNVMWAVICLFGVLLCIFSGVLCFHRGFRYAVILNFFTAVGWFVVGAMHVRSLILDRKGK